MFGDMYMLHLKSTDPANEQTDMLVIPVCEDKELNRNPAIKDIVRRIRRLKEFVGAAVEEIILYDLPSLKTKRVKVAGEPAESTKAKLRIAAELELLIRDALSSRWKK